MAFLVIAGITVPVAVDQFKRLPLETVGTQTRAYAGNLRSTQRWTKRAWSLTTGLMLTADTTTLEAAIANGAVVGCSGDALGAAINCVATIGEKVNVSTAASDGLTFMWTLALTLREV